jgi:putative hydrolase of the HAD superfamily
VRTDLILVDLDGTLVDHDAAEQAAIAGWIADAGFPTAIGGTPSERIWHDLAEEAFTEHRAGRLTFPEQRRQRVARFLPLMGVDTHLMSEGDLDAQFLNYLHRYEAAWVAYPDAVGSLTLLNAHYRVAVLSNGDQSQQQDKVDRTGLSGLLETVITSSVLGVSKPDPAAFTLAAARLGVAPATVVYVGDRLDVDARAASAAGMRGIWLNRTRSDAAAPDVTTIRSLSELPALL